MKYLKITPKINFEIRVPNFIKVIVFYSMAFWEVTFPFWIILVYLVTGISLIIFFGYLWNCTGYSPAVTNAPPLVVEWFMKGVLVAFAFLLVYCVARGTFKGIKILFTNVNKEYKQIRKESNE